MRELCKVQAGEDLGVLGRALLALTTLAAVTLLVGRGPSAIRTPQSSFLLLRRLDSPRPFSFWLVVLVVERSRILAGGEQIPIYFRSLMQAY